MICIFVYIRNMEIMLQLSTVANPDLHLRWLEGLQIFPSLVFYCNYINNVEVKLLVQLC